MGKMGIQADSEASYQLTWTWDGENWCARSFRSLDDARETARALIGSNGGNDAFQWFAQRLVVVSSEDFLSGKRGTEMTVRERLTLPDGHYGEGR